ncbi:type I polyketide synthase [Lyngbya confervoides]|uniref:SDR family NAD(P)-dependent oxidoreductase n=1 Tax=Lyngbya confervoides BDU141951 TaxID=1574623 RepID=A0ABD4T8N2_9CYAN|nr:type I polyketide synthase [Lyngbya confervoides]MCM1984976.1 SDR family NAD(P)-dependent oxidoreductase [Lyngbya confervoides BDU141951]
MTIFDSNSDNFVDLLEFWAKKQPNKTLYTFLKDGEQEESHLTFQDLHVRARRVAQELQKYASPGDRALLLYPAGLDFTIGFFACLYAGLIAVPAYPPRQNQSLSRLQAIAADCQAVLALSTQKIITDVRRWGKSDPISDRLIWLATTEIHFNDLKDLSHQLPSPTSDKIALLQYTSGSTGTPKGVMVSHGNLVQNCKTIYTCFDGSREQIGVSWLPFHHDMGLIGGVLEPLFAGGSMIFMAPVSFLQKPARWLRAISDYHADISGGPNFAYDLCIQTCKPNQMEGIDLSQWQLAFNGAEPIRGETLDQFSETFAPYGFKRNALYACYGMAETTLLVTGGQRATPSIMRRFDAKELTQNRVVPSSNPQDSKLLVGCGHPWLDHQVLIVDPETLTRCDPETIGEIWVSGASVAQGYWQKSEITKNTFHAYLADSEDGPYLRTGDLGFFWHDSEAEQFSGVSDLGELFVTGRLKDVVIIRGQNHYPQDIELTAETCHPALQKNSGAAFSIEVNNSEQLVLVQEVKRSHLRELSSDSVKADEVILAIRRAISEAHELQIYAIELLTPGSLPKTTSGKVMRRQSRCNFLEESFTSVAKWELNLEGQKNNPGFAKPSSKLDGVEKVQVLKDWLVNQIAQRMQLSVDQIDPDQPLASYGLDSIQVVTMSADLEAWLGMAVSPTIIYDYPTIDGLARKLALDEEPNLAVQFPQHRRGDHEAIAVIGMGGRFPGAPTLKAFWDLLKNGNDAIIEVPASRWNVDNVDPFSDIELPARWGGFIEDIDQFDPKFFGISPREASAMDPQQRLLLEVCWETLEYAGLVPEQLAGSQSGIFLGMSNGDYSRLQGIQLSKEIYYGTGNAFSIAANRLSYLLDWHGPSLVVDTACSSSLVAIHQACQSLNAGECDLALAGGVNLILNPQLTLTFSEAQMMASDGRCKTFDASADGYVRSEGCGVIALKRLSDAQQNGDSIIALIKGSAMNQDGRSNGLTAPNSLAQQAVIRQALANSGFEADQVDYIEAHGTGTSLGDPIEVNALKSIFLAPRDNQHSCWLGSVKTNIGHLEPAAGIAGLIKVLLALQHEEIPPHLHLKEINPYIQLEGTPLKIPTTGQAWPQGERPRIAGVSSFGFGGTNAHVIVTEPPQRETVLVEPAAKHLPPDQLAESDPLPQILTLSAKSELALQTLVSQYGDLLEDLCRKGESLNDHASNGHVSKNGSHYSLANICFTANMGRSHYNWRLAVTSASLGQLQQQLEGFISGKKTPDVISGYVDKSNIPAIVFLFTGQGSQYIDMGRQLYETQPVFRAELDKCDQILRSYLDQPLLSVLYPHSNDPVNNQDLDPQEASGVHSPPQSLLDQTGYTQPALFAIEYALAKLWQAWGIQPDFVLGHSVGEYAAACIAGVMSLEDGLRLIVNRGQLMQALPAGGAMLAILAPLETVQNWIEPYKSEVEIAAINGPTSVVISGVETVIQNIAANLSTQAIKHKRLNVSHAFHSALMDPMVKPFAQIAETVSYALPEIPFVSCLTGTQVDQDIAKADYWIQHLKAPVRFLEGMQVIGAIASKQSAPPIYLEVGPKPLMLGMGRQCLAKAPGAWLPSLRPDIFDLHQVLQSLGHLHVNGIAVNWNAVYATSSDQTGSDPIGHTQIKSHQKVSLPTYPFQRQRYWIEAHPTVPNVELFPASGSEARAARSAVHPLLGQRFHSAIRQIQFQSNLSPNVPSFLSDHRVFGHVILPASAYCEMALAAGIASNQPNQHTLQLTNLKFQRGLILPETQGLTVQTILTPLEQDSYHFEIFSLQSEDNTETDGGAAQEPTWIAHAQGTVERVGGATQAEPAHLTFDRETDQATLPKQISVTDFYQSLNQWGLEYGQAFQGVKRLWASPERALGEIELNEFLAQSINTYQLHPVLLDASFQILAAVIGQSQDQGIYLPAGVQRLRVYHPVPSQLWAKGEILDGSGLNDAPTNSVGLGPEKRNLMGEVQLFDESGKLIAHVEGLTLARTNRQVLMRYLEPERTPEFYEPIWEQKALITAERDTAFASTPSPTGAWLIFTVPPIGHKIAEGLRQHTFHLPPHLQPPEAQAPVDLPPGVLAPANLDPAESASSELGYLFVTPGNNYQRIDPQHYQLNPSEPEHFQALFRSLLDQDVSLRGVIHLWSLNPDTSTPSASLDRIQSLKCESVLYLVQALTQVYTRTSLDLWLVTQGAQILAGDGTTIQVHQSPLWGLGRVIALEYPEFSCRTLDLDPSIDLNTAEISNADLEKVGLQQLLQELISPDVESQIAYRRGGRWVARIAPVKTLSKTPRLALPLEDAFQLKLKEYGLIDNLTLQPISRRNPGAHEIEIRVEAAGLNFRDVLNALGLLKDYYAEHLGITSANQLTFGFECAGTVVATGEEVTQFKVGDEVMATMLMDGVSCYVTTRVEFAIAKPKHLSFAQAATLPLAFLTAYYGLVHLAKLQPGERVLIHAAAGGVGQAAVQIAQWIGAEVYATASPGKWSVLQGQGVTHVMNSRSLLFADEVIQSTHGKGVDVVLNSFNGDYIGKSFEALAPNGRFVELGKIGIWDRTKVHQQYPGAQYFPFDLGDETKADPWLICELLQKLQDHFEAKTLKPLPFKQFPIQQGIRAFRYMQQARHIGKVVLTFPSPSQQAELSGLSINPAGSYLITGGLGALGLQVAQWLVHQGAKQLILMGRRSPSDQALARIEQLETNGAKVSVQLGDISCWAEAAPIFKTIAATLPPLTGVFHAAGVLDDGLLAQLSWKRFTQVMAPKVAGSWNLHQLTKSLSLDYFVLFSSMASLIGSPGQGSYAAANTFMDSLVQYRHQKGLPGLSINWGAWAEVGMAAELSPQQKARLESRGIYPISPQKGIQALGELLGSDRPQVGVLQIDWLKFMNQLPKGIELPLLSAFQSPASAQSDTRVQWLEQLRQLPSCDRRNFLTLQIRTEVAEVLGFNTPEEVPLDETLSDLGVDSLMAVELSNQLEENIGESIPASFLFEHPTLYELIDYLIEQVPELEFDPQNNDQQI